MSDFLSILLESKRQGQHSQPQPTSRLFVCWGTCLTLQTTRAFSQAMQPTAWWSEIPTLLGAHVLLGLVRCSGKGSVSLSESGKLPSQGMQPALSLPYRDANLTPCLLTGPGLSGHRTGCLSTAFANLVAGCENLFSPTKLIATGSRPPGLSVNTHTHAQCPLTLSPSLVLSLAYPSLPLAGVWAEVRVSHADTGLDATWVSA